MVWRPEDEPEFKLHEALIVVEEIRGHEKTLAMLKQEVTRLEVLERLRAARRPALLAAPVGTADARNIDAAAAALAFYGDKTNYAVIGNRKSEVARDAGRRARAALTEIESGKTSDGNGESE